MTISQSTMLRTHKFHSQLKQSLLSWRHLRRISTNARRRVSRIMVINTFVIVLTNIVVIIVIKINFFSHFTAVFVRAPRREAALLSGSGFGSGGGASE
jgi:hypothetical protein